MDGLGLNYTRLDKWEVDWDGQVGNGLILVLAIIIMGMGLYWLGIGVD